MVGGREAYLDKDGNLNKTFDTRVKNAVLSATLGNNRQIVEKLLEDPAGFDKIVKGLLKSISSLVKLNAKNPSYELSHSPRKINPNARLPETNVSMGDIRRYLSQALDIPIKSEFSKSAKRAGGLYYPDRELIRLKDDYWNDLSVFGHEVFHYLHRMIFGGDNFHHKNVDQFDYI